MPINYPSFPSQQPTPVPNPIPPTVFDSREIRYEYQAIVGSLAQNIMARKILELYDVGFGDRGYGQLAKASLALHHPYLSWPHQPPIRSQNDLVRGYDWFQKWAALMVCARHLGLNLSDMPSSDELQPNKIIRAYEQFIRKLEQIESNRLDFGVDSMSLYGPSLVAQRTTNWSNKIRMNFSVNFPTADDARYFFNSGGDIRILVERNGTNDQPQDAFWTAFLNNIGMIRFNATETRQAINSESFRQVGSGSDIGYYGISTTWQRIYLADGYEVSGNDQTAIVLSSNRHSMRATSSTTSRAQGFTMAEPPCDCPDGFTPTGNGWCEGIDELDEALQALPYSHTIRVTEDMTGTMIWDQLNSFTKDYGIWVSADGSRPYLRLDNPATVVGTFTITEGGLYTLTTAGFNNMVVYINGLYVWEGGNFLVDETPTRTTIRLCPGHYIIELACTVTQDAGNSPGRFFTPISGAMAVTIENQDTGALVYNTLQNTLPPYKQCFNGYQLDYTDMKCKKFILVHCGPCNQPPLGDLPSDGWARFGKTGYQTRLLEIDNPTKLTHHILSEAMYTSEVWHQKIHEYGVWPSDDGMYPVTTKNEEISFGFTPTTPGEGWYYLTFGGTDYCEFRINGLTIATLKSGASQYWFGENQEYKFYLPAGKFTVSCHAYNWSFDPTGNWHNLDDWKWNPSVIAFEIYDCATNQPIFISTSFPVNHPVKAICPSGFTYNEEADKCYQNEGSAPCNWADTVTRGPLTFNHSLSLSYPPGPGIPEVPEPVNEIVNLPTSLNITSDMDSGEILNTILSETNCCHIQYAGNNQSRSTAENGRFEINLVVPSCVVKESDYITCYLTIRDNKYDLYHQYNIFKTIDIFLDGTYLPCQMVFQPPNTWYFRIPNDMILGCTKSQMVKATVVFNDVIMVSTQTKFNGDNGSVAGPVSVYEDQVQHYLNTILNTKPKVIDINGQIHTTGVVEYTSPPTRVDLTDSCPDGVDPASTQIIRVAATNCHPAVFPNWDQIADEPSCGVVYARCSMPYLHAETEAKCLVPVTSTFWGTELNNRAVWLSINCTDPVQVQGIDVLLTATLNITSAGTHTFKYSADNSLVLMINNQTFSCPCNFTDWYTTTVDLPVGSHTLYITANNFVSDAAWSKNPAGFGFSVYDPGGTEIYNSRIPNLIQVQRNSTASIQTLSTMIASRHRKRPTKFYGCESYTGPITKTGERLYSCYEYQVKPSRIYELMLSNNGPTRVEVFFCGAKAFDTGWIPFSDQSGTYNPDPTSKMWTICSPPIEHECEWTNIVVTTGSDYVTDDQGSIVPPSYALSFGEVKFTNVSDHYCFDIKYNGRDFIFDTIYKPEQIHALDGNISTIQAQLGKKYSTLDKPSKVWRFENLLPNKLMVIEYSNKSSSPCQFDIIINNRIIAKSGPISTKIQDCVLESRSLEFCIGSSTVFDLKFADHNDYTFLVKYVDGELSCSDNPYTSAPTSWFGNYKPIKPATAFQSWIRRQELLETVWQSPQTDILNALDHYGPSLPKIKVPDIYRNLDFSGPFPTESIKKQAHEKYTQQEIIPQPQEKPKTSKTKWNENGPPKPNNDVTVVENSVPQTSTGMSFTNEPQIFGPVAINDYDIEETLVKTHVIPQIYASIQNRNLPTTLMAPLSPENVEHKNESTNERTNEPTENLDLEEWIIVCEKNIDYDVFESDLQSRGINILYDYLYLDHYLVKADDEIVLGLQTDPRVKLVERNQIQVVTSCNEQILNFSWGSTGPTQNWGLYSVERLDLNGFPNSLPPDQIYSWSQSGEGVDVVILDTGILLDHFEFEGRTKSAIYDVRTNSTFAGHPDFNVITSTDPSYGIDDCGHGTHVAGSACGNTVGVSRGSNIRAAKIFIFAPSNPPGSQTYGQTSWSIDGMNAIVAWHRQKYENGTNAPTVLNMSIAAGSAMLTALQNCVEAGIIVCGAAGNDGRNLDDTSYNIFPAEYSPIITVGSISPDLTGFVDSNGNRLTNVQNQISSFSNFGSFVDVFAPGGYIYSASWQGQDKYRTDSGTSMACPHVAGVLALYAQGRNIGTSSSEMSAAQTWIKTTGSKDNEVVLTSNVINTTRRLLYQPFICSEQPSQSSSPPASSGSSDGIQLPPPIPPEVLAGADRHRLDGNPNAVYQPVANGYGTTRSQTNADGQDYSFHRDMDIETTSHPTVNVIEEGDDPVWTVTQNPYRTNSLEIWVRGVPNSSGQLSQTPNGDKGNQIEFEIVLTDDHENSGGYDEITGNIKCQIYYQKATRYLGITSPSISSVTSPPLHDHLGGVGGGGGGGSPLQNDRNDYTPNINFSATVRQQIKQPFVIASYRDSIKFEWNMQKIADFRVETQIVDGNCFYLERYGNDPFDWFPVLDRNGTTTVDSNKPICLKPFEGCKLRTTIIGTGDNGASITDYVDVLISSRCQCPDDYGVDPVTGNCFKQETITPTLLYGRYHTIPLTSHHWHHILNQYAIWITNDGVSPHQLVNTTVAIGFFYECATDETLTVEYSSDDQLLILVNGCIRYENWDHSNWFSNPLPVPAGKNYIEFRIKNVDFSRSEVDNPGGVAAIVKNQNGDVLWHTRQGGIETASFGCDCNSLPDFENVVCTHYDIIECPNGQECPGYEQTSKNYVWGYELVNVGMGLSSWAGVDTMQLKYRGNRARERHVVGKKFWTNMGWIIFDPSTYGRLNPDVESDIANGLYGWNYTLLDHFIDYGAFEGQFGRCVSDTITSGPFYPCSVLLNDDLNRNWGWSFVGSVLYIQGSKATRDDIEGAVFSTTTGYVTFKGLNFGLSNADVLAHLNIGHDRNRVPLNRLIQDPWDYFIERGAWESINGGRCIQMDTLEARPTGRFVEAYENYVKGWSLKPYPTDNKYRYLAFNDVKATPAQIEGALFWTSREQYEPFITEEYLRINPGIKLMFDRGQWPDGQALPSGYTPAQHFIDYGAFEGRYGRSFNG